MAAIRTMVNAPIPLRAARLPRNYRCRIDEAQSAELNASSDVLRAAMVWQNPTNAHWVRMSPPSAVDQLFARYAADERATFYIILATKPAPRALCFSGDFSARRVFHAFGSVP